MSECHTQAGATDSVWELQYEQVYREHASRVLGLARLLLRDAAEAQDVAQEVFVKAAVAVRAAEPPRDWRSWLTRVVVNACRSRARGGWWRRFRRLGEPLDVRDLIDGAAGPEARAAARDLTERLWTVFRTLPERQRMVFVLRHVDERSTAEVADVLGLTEGAVKTHLFRAVHRLRRALEP